LVKIQFMNELPNPANLKVKTPIKRVIVKGNTIEVEFDGEPDENELKIIAVKLRKNKVLRNPKKIIGRG